MRALRSRGEPVAGWTPHARCWAIPALSTTA